MPRMACGWLLLVLLVGGCGDDSGSPAVDASSVDHPAVVEHYRAAYAIARRNEKGQAQTEDMRQALVHYRALFQELIETGSAQGPAQEPEEAHDDRVWHKAA